MEGGYKVITRDEVMEALLSTKNLREARSKLANKSKSSMVSWLEKYDIWPEEYKNAQAVNWAREKTKTIMQNKPDIEWLDLVNIVAAAERSRDVRTSQLRAIYDEIKQKKSANEMGSKEIA